MIREFCFAFRMLLKNRLYTIAAVLTLGLGIGANTAIFSVVNNIFFRPLPLADSDQLVRLHDSVKDPSGHRVMFNISARNLLRMRERNRVFSGFSAQEIENMTLSAGSTPERVSVVHTAGDSWKTLGARPLLGRLFSEEEARAGGASRAALISYSFWQHHFAGAESLGATLSLNNRSYTVVGILPLGFNFPYDAQVWIPTTLDPEARTQYGVFARLAPGVTLEQARAQMIAASQQMSAEYNDITPGYGIEVTPLRESLIENEGRNAMTLLVVVGFLLLLACANVANLTLARSMSRQRELAIRSALGATRWRIARQLLIESVLLSVIGTIVGLLLTVWLGRYLVTLIPPNLSEQLGLTNVSLDFRLAAFASLAAILTGAFSGLVPALRSSSLDLQSALKEGGKTSHGSKSRRLLNAFVISEIALAFILLAGAAMMFENLRGLSRKTLGFEKNNLLTMQMTLSVERYPDGPRRSEFVRQILEKINQAPGVTSTGVTTINPLAGATSTRAVAVEGLEATNASYEVNHRLVSPGLFHAMGIRLIKGRDFAPQDDERSSGVAVISEGMARRFWPGQDPLQKYIRVNRAGEPWLTVIGIVADLQERGQIHETWYLPYLQQAATPSAEIIILMVRGVGDAARLTQPVEQAIWSVDRNMAVYKVETMNRVHSEALSQDRLGTITVTLFAFFGLILAAVGIYGLMSFAVAQRIQEIAIRIALGAQKSDILRILFIDGSKLVLLGVAIGAVGAFGVTRGMTSLLVEAKALNLVSYALASIALGLLAFIACLLPARKASRVDPIIALRTE
jgi:putative ABC transport system permease protein